MKELAQIPALDMSFEWLLLRFRGDPRRADHISNSNRRLVFRIRNGLADDKSAQRFAEAALATLTLLYGAITDEIPLVLRLPSSVLRGKTLTVGRLLKSSRVVELDDMPEWELWRHLGSSISVPDGVLAEVWRLLPAAANEPFFTAAHYYMASVLRYSFLGDDISEVLENDPDTPVLGAHIVRAEGAVHDAFKAVESLIGEPPKHEGRLRLKLKEIGVGPDEPIGFSWFGRGPTREPVARKVRRMHTLRDKRSAHAKTDRKSALTYYEMMDSQGTARFVLLTSMNAFLRQQEPTA